MIRFGEFALEPDERRLSRAGETLDVQGRYFDALHLLLREPGRLVTKDRFMDEVWRGVPVTDEALTQCIRALRKALGDDAARPRFIETVPKHGYRFVAAVEGSRPASATVPTEDPRVGDLVAGTLGGAAAGVVGGIVYGSLAVSGMGALSLLLVVTAITTLVAMFGALGVSAGLVLANRAGGDWRLPLGGAICGGVVGGAFRLVSGDALMLVTGQTPGAVAGGMEGLVLGGAVGFGAMLASRAVAALGTWRAAGLAGLVGALGGGLVAAFGGRLMAASLDELVRRYPQSHLSLDWFGALFGEDGFGSVARYVTGAAEGALFAAAIVGAMLWARRRA